MVSILSTVERVDWERQLWLYALKFDKPLETYRDLLAQLAKTSAPAPSLDELPKQRLEWLRAT